MFELEFRPKGRSCIPCVFPVHKSQKACLLGRLKRCSTQRMVVPFLTGQPGAVRATHETDGASLAGPQKTQSSGLNSRQ